MSELERIARKMEPDVWMTIDGDFWVGRDETIANSLERARVALEADPSLGKVDG